MKYIRVRLIFFLCGISLFSFTKALDINPLIRAVVGYGLIYLAIESSADYKMQSFKHPLACVAATCCVIAVPTGSTGKIIVGAVGAGLTARAIRSANSNYPIQKSLGDEVIDFCHALDCATSNTSIIKGTFHKWITQESQQNITRLLEGVAVGATLVAMAT